MQSQNQNHTGQSPYNTADTPGIEKWRFYTVGSVDGGIVIDSDGTLYFGDFFGHVTALNPDGSLKWRYKLDDLAFVFTSCPCIGEDGIIYVSAYDYKLYAFYPIGWPKWVLDTGGNMGSSPAIGHDGTIYVGHHNNDLVAVDPIGTIKWKFSTGSNVISDPTIHPDGTIIIGSMDGFIYAVNPNGTLRWKYQTDDIIRGHASIDSQGIIYYSCWDGYLYAFYVNGTLKKKFDMPIPGGETMAIGSDGTIYVTYDGIVAIDPDTWTVKWKFDFLREDEFAYLPSPAISADGIIYIGTAIGQAVGGQIYAINPDGTLRWRKKIANNNVIGSPAIDENGTVYVGS
jgi:outer membrane protein assembly factor BamB